MSESMAHGTFPPESGFDEAIINAVLVFDDNDRPSVDEIVEHCVKKFLRYDRFSSIFDRRSSTVTPCGDALDPHDLVRVVPVSQCASVEALLEVMEGQAFIPLAESPRGEILPWWEFVFLENTSTNKGGKSAVVWRIHHSLGDGLSLVQMVQDVFVNAKTGQPLSNGVNDSHPNASKKFRVHRSPMQWIAQTLSALLTVVPLPMGKFDDLTMIRGDETTDRAKTINPKELIFPAKQAIIPFTPIPLGFVKQLKTAASSRDGNARRVTVNDILFTIMSHAMHTFLKEENDPSLESKGEELVCRTLLPMALPRPTAKEKAGALRNLWCFISCDLSVGTSNVLDRLWKINDNLTTLKKGLVPMVSAFLSSIVMKWLPRVIGRDQVIQLFSRHSMVLSNVPGPPEPVSFANHEVQAVHMIHMNIIPQLSFLSYRDIIFCNAIVGIEGNGRDEDTLSKRRRKRLPIHLNNALVVLAKELQVTSIPESIAEDAKQLTVA